MKKQTQLPIMYAGIDYHKHYSVVHVIDAEGHKVFQGRVEGNRPEGFTALFQSLGAHIEAVLEASMNWHYLYEILEEIECVDEIVLAHPYKTRIIAEAQVKTDKIDAKMLAILLRGNLIAQAHVSSKEARRRKELLRQRTCWVKMRTRIRNRTHRLLGWQHDLELPQCSDIFGRKGMSFLTKLELPDPAGLLLAQNLEALKELAPKIKEDEKALKEELKGDEAVTLLQSIPGVGPIIGAVIASEIDGIDRFVSAKKLCGYAGLAPTTSSSGGKTYNGRLMPMCNKWLRWAFVEAAWVAVGCDPYFGTLYKAHKARGKKANTAILIVAKRIAKISYALLKEKRRYEPRSNFKKTFPDRSDLGLAGAAA
jgi:transposase